MPLSIVNSTTRVQPAPKIYSGWALDRAIILDCACPGFLASSMYYGPARRQTMFLLLASFDWLEQAEIAARIRRHAAGIDDTAKLDDVALLGRAVMLLRRPRDLTQAVFGCVPDGLLGAMQRLGHDPASSADSYQELYRLFASFDPADRRRVKVLGQMSGSLVAAQIQIVSLLDPILLHPALISKISSVEQVSQLHHALAYVRLVACPLKGGPP